MIVHRRLYISSNAIGIYSQELNSTITVGRALLDVSCLTCQLVLVDLAVQSQWKGYGTPYHSNVV